MFVFLFVFFVIFEVCILVPRSPSVLVLQAILFNLKRKGVWWLRVQWVVPAPEIHVWPIRFKDLKFCTLLLSNNDAHTYIASCAKFVVVRDIFCNYWTTHGHHTPFLLRLWVACETITILNIIPDTVLLCVSLLQKITTTEFVLLWALQGFIPVTYTEPDVHDEPHPPVHAPMDDGSGCIKRR